MKHATAISFLLLGVVIGFAAGFIIGWRQRQFDVALQENKVAAVNLKFYGTNVSPEFREYLKARIFCNVYNYYPGDRGYLLQTDWDFGPVDRSILGPIAVWKDPDEKVWDWAAAITNK